MTEKAYRYGMLAAAWMAVAALAVIAYAAFQLPASRQCETWPGFDDYLYDNCVYVIVDNPDQSPLPITVPPDLP